MASSAASGQDEPNRAMWLAIRAGEMEPSRLARLGLPAVYRKKNFPESHIINPLLTKFVRSRWLDIGLVLFLVFLFGEFMDLDFVSIHKQAKKKKKKKLANIQLFWPHTWSISHVHWNKCFLQNVRKSCEVSYPTSASGVIVEWHGY